MRRRPLRWLLRKRKTRKTRSSKMKNRHKEIRNVQIKKKESLGNKRLRRLLRQFTRKLLISWQLVQRLRRMRSSKRF